MQPTSPKTRGVPIVLALLAALAAAPAAVSAWAAEADGREPPSTGHTELVPMPTLGGKQFWADELFFHQWRIQRNALDGHCRLLDGHDRRHAWGTFDECRARLEQIKREQRLPPMRGAAVIVLHGLGRSRDSMDKLCRYLEDEGGYTVLNVSYPSTRRDIGGHALALRRIVENLDGVEQIDFVGHSMGNIIIRHYLADAMASRTAASSQAARARLDPRIRRFVMLAPPNHGSRAADALADNPLFKAATGPAGQELGVDWDELERWLAVPPCEFGIVAGGRGDAKGYNPLLPGDDDGTITVDTARLAGASDFLLVPVMHTFIMDDKTVMQCTLRFLEHGYFLSPEQRRPIEK
jgi:pimeloyl-ACP methyl ester carboxylesterase